MEQARFPGLAEHCAEHQRLMTHLMESAHRVQRGEAIPLQPMLCLLRDTYIEHIEGPDREYGPWLNERGVE
jgi:hemerythrin